MIKRCLPLMCLILLLSRDTDAQQRDSLRLNLAAPVGLPVSRPTNWPGAHVATCNYGFFCRQELKADKKLPVPVRLRLGSMQMTDWLERKPNARPPQQ